MKLIIAEKPDQGLTLASIFKTKKSQGFIEILPNEIFKDGAFVTWAVGQYANLWRLKHIIYNGKNGRFRCYR